MIRSDLTVMMVARDSQKTIRSAVLSALKAMRFDDKLLIYLDACRDNTLQVVKMLSSDRRVKYLVGAQHLGINQGRNLLLSEAKTELVAVLDSDDLCLPWRFKVSVPHMADNTAVFGTALVFGAQLRPLPLLPQYPIYLSNENLRLSLSISNPVVHSTALLRRDEIISLGGYSSAVSEDYELWLRLANNNSAMIRMSKALVGYRFHASQISQDVDFVGSLQSDGLLEFQRNILRSEIAKQYFANSDEPIEISRISNILYRKVPGMKMEHYGLPKFLKQWKNKK